ncbi:protein JTB isoform 1-T3 [Pholidichthys leucotaenia]
MESDCRIPMYCCRPRVLVLHAVFWGLVSLRVFGAALLSEEKSTSVQPLATPCWMMEDYVVTEECEQCSDFTWRSQSVCRKTGYVERVNCSRSNREEYRSCRSALMEERLFWKFEAAMLVLTLVFSILVVVRQRRNDRRASEKVQRQIQSI